jgi:small basic protein (TIGR04137 family)
MSMDRTLKAGSGLVRSRSVLSRTERIKLLSDEGRFDPAVQSPFGLPKVKVRHSKAGQKVKKAAEEVVPGVEGAEAGAAAAPAPAADAAKGKADTAAKGKAGTAPKGKADAAPKGKAGAAAKGKKG